MTPRNRQPNSANDRPEDGRMWLSIAGSRNRNALPGMTGRERHASRPGGDRTALPDNGAKIHFLHGHEAADQSHSQGPPERDGRAYMPRLECFEGAVHMGPLPCRCGGRRAGRGHASK
jgi:hypothetical protein